MEDKREMSFGCCSDLPESLLHTGDRWDYPKWYLNYVRGIGNKKLTKTVRNYLQYLKDGRWKVKTAMIGTGSLEAMVEIGLVVMSPVVKPFRIFVAEVDREPISDIDNIRQFTEGFNSLGRGFYCSYKITDKGRRSLVNNLLP